MIIFIFIFISIHFYADLFSCVLKCSSVAELQFTLEYLNVLNIPMGFSYYYLLLFTIIFIIIYYYLLLYLLFIIIFIIIIMTYYKLILKYFIKCPCATMYKVKSVLSDFYK